MDTSIIGCPKTSAIDLAQGNNIRKYRIRAYKGKQTWFKLLIPLELWQAHFDAPEGEEPVALDMEGMGKGQIWINGQSVGRYWTAYARGNCSRCNYATTFRPPKCQLGCGQPTQRW